MSQFTVVVQKVNIVTSNLAWHCACNEYYRNIWKAAEKVERFCNEVDLLQKSLHTLVVR